MKHEAIYSLYSSVVSIDGDGDKAVAYDKDWNVVSLDADAVATKITELQTAYDNNAYQRSRATEYPPIAEQLDDIYHNGIDGWKTTIKTIKDKHPKE
jgi:hypothetical protein|tara:strand:- start:1100 stop:1390 length:291 start_codon:yes stop_codon:yes gene_type:complete